MLDEDERKLEKQIDNLLNAMSIEDALYEMDLSCEEVLLILIREGFAKLPDFVNEEAFLHDAYRSIHEDEDGLEE